jgi:hypothetical protein
MPPVRPYWGQRTSAGAERGVWFTAADIVEIGRMLPELMSARRVSREAGPPGGQLPAAALAAPARPELPAEKLAEWAQLSSHRRTSRRSPRRR